MNVVLWIIAGVLALAFLAAGVMKLTQPKPKLIEAGMGWAEGYHPVAVKLIGLAEVLAAIGLILPAALDIAPILVPLAATGLAVIMVGAVVVHARRKENPMVIGNVVLLILSVVVAWGRFGPYSF
ncbi:DoxX family protein [Paractinoplanes durhamensis]|uniref:DoxX family protein n=1 Tax=Paractinoplanes durhamensis TaxID=113563 RepID=A0ABQ3Z938_9ACTN|nr:DoxX family protein [Actinoplanes durhamensis]GIE06341.1 hypothetical protein Adu01nite_76910 [Actinoplanes durhamensis]